MRYYSWPRVTLCLQAHHTAPKASRAKGQNLTRGSKFGSATVISSRLKVNGGGSAMTQYLYDCDLNSE